MSSIQHFTRSLFSYGFRPLFLLAGFHALFSILLWMLYWTGTMTTQLNRPISLFHGHEMLSGFVAAAIGGFLLTAIANWTNRPPVSGLPLAALCLLWLLGRLAFNLPIAAAIGDIGYWVLLTALAARELLIAGNRRNYKILFVLGAFITTDALYHIAELNGSALLREAVWLQLWLTIILINLIGGRIIPAFTGNWLRNTAMARQSAAPAMPPAFNRLDLAATLALLSFVVLLFAPLGSASPAIIAGSIASLLQAIRLSRWKGLQTGEEPLVWMLHLAYAWIPVGLALWTASLAGLLPVSAAVHALSSGAIASMIVAVSARAALGHSGHALKSHPLLTLAIVLLSVTTVLRILSTVFVNELILLSAAGLWVAAFACYLWRLAPILTRPV